MIKILSLFFYFFVILYSSEEIHEAEIQEQQSKVFKDALKSLQVWYHSIGILNIYFDNGNLQYGFGILLKNGKFLTSSEILHNFGKYPQRIEVRMQDDSANPIICVANLQIQTIDRDLGLALLNTRNFTNDYCQKRQESFYHKRIYDLFYLQITNSHFPLKTKVYYPKISKKYTFEASESEILSRTSVNEENDSYIYNIDELKMDKIILGRPFFDKEGKFVGIYTIYQNSIRPVVVDSTIINQFIKKKF